MDSQTDRHRDGDRAGVDPRGPDRAVEVRHETDQHVGRWNLDPQRRTVGIGRTFVSCRARSVEDQCLHHCVGEPRGRHPGVMGPKLYKFALSRSPADWRGFDDALLIGSHDAAVASDDLIDVQVGPRQPGVVARDDIEPPRPARKKAALVSLIVGDGVDHDLVGGGHGRGSKRNRPSLIDRPLTCGGELDPARLGAYRIGWRGRRTRSASGRTGQACRRRRRE